MERKREKIEKFNLVTGEDTFASQTAQAGSSTSRRLKSLIPSIAGDLTRELAQPKYLVTQLNGPVGALYEFDQNSGSGVVTRHYFAATATKLYENLGGVWAEVIAITNGGGLHGYPQFYTQNNLCHLVDGTNNWLYDGAGWVLEGFPIPLVTPTIDTTLTPGGAATIVAGPGGILNETGHGVVTVTTTAPHGFLTGMRVVLAGALRTALNIAAVNGAVRDSAGITSVITTTANHGLNTGETVNIAGVTDATFNAAGVVISKITSTTFSYVNNGTANASSGNGTVVLILDGTVTITSVVSPTSFNYLNGLYNTLVPFAGGGGTATALVFTTLTNRYYWMTFADETAGRIHESSSSPISLGTGPLTNKLVVVYPFPGTVNLTLGSVNVIGVGTQFTKLYNGYDKQLIVNLNGGTGVSNFGTIANVIDDTHLTLNVAAGATEASSHYLIVPARFTNWHLYASESENSKIGYYLATLPFTSTFYIDQSPFIGTAGSSFLQINRPVRNDPAPASIMATVHKFRAFRRRETRPNFFNFSANEEVSSTVNGSPQESVPGADVNTISDIINEDSYPVESNRIRALTSHSDALYIGTEKETLPLFGDTYTDFALSQVNVFSMGIAGRYAMISTPHGLVFMSYDRKLFIYPTSNYPWAYIPKDVNATEKLIEIGRPNRKNFEKILPTDLDNVRLLHYHYGRRDWLVVCFQDKTNVDHTWIYDFETKTWFETQRGFTSVATFEVTAGNIVLIGGARDGYVYVVDDLTGTFTNAGASPTALWRPSLIDFGDENVQHLIQYLEFELSSAAMAQSITINYYLDPVDADNPGVPKKIVMTKVSGANAYRGFWQDGSVCQRLLLEFNIASDTNIGAIRGIKLKAVPISGMIA